MTSSLHSHIPASLSPSHQNATTSCHFTLETSIQSLIMATNSLQSLHHRNNLLKIQLPAQETTPSPLFSLKPTTNNTPLPTLSISTSTTALFSVSPAVSSSSAAPSTSQPPSVASLDLLRQHLSTQNFREADEVTRRLLIILSGEAAQKRGYVFFSEVQFIADKDLRAIDDLWKEHSNNKFGYSVQKKIWEQKSDKDFSRFFVKVGWMKKLDTEVVQYNYRSFPTEFIWELDDDTPEGHLPLTNALRGTQLLTMIFTHPAFVSEEEEVAGGDGEAEGTKNQNTLMKNRVFKTDYSF